MFIPYEVDTLFDHRPVVNWLVMGGIILVFILQIITSEKWKAKEPPRIVDKPIEEVMTAPAEEAPRKPAEEKYAITGPMARLALNGWGIGLLTYIWLHAGVLHGTVRVIGNLIFLWPFGNAICGKLGNKIYLLIYFGFGLLAGLIHLIVSSGEAVGAGGVICGIIGMYIVLYPEEMISCFVLLPRPMATSISGYWIVALWFIFDILEAGAGGQTVTYFAHILCTAAGAGLAVLMLKKNWLVMDKDEKTLLQMLSKKEEKEEETAEKKGKEGQKDLESAVKQPEVVEKAKVEPKVVTAEAKKPDDDFIRFKCECGHRIKVHKKDAGKAGRCPKCSRWLEAPSA
jgi:membrane associated rhomboid family serine protease